MRTEHTIGFLKQRWRSLLLMALVIRDKHTFKIMNRWIEACIVLHRWAQENEHFGSEEDPFVPKDRARANNGRREEPEEVGPAEGRSSRVVAVAKKMRELRKKELFAALEKKKQNRSNMRLMRR